MTHLLMVATPMQSLGGHTTISLKRKSHDQDLVFTTIQTNNYSDNEEEDERDELEEDETHPDASIVSAGSSSYKVQFSMRQAAEKNLDAEHPGEENEYEAGRVICDVCGEGVSIRDEKTGAFSVTKFNEHRYSCGATTSKQPIQHAASSPVVASLLKAATPSAVPKKRRAKRSEEERINFFRTDPHVAQFEAYRVLCGSCNKWIRLRSNSSYCSIPWEAHRKSCLSKKSVQPRSPSEQRKRLFSNDPHVRDVEKDRVLCNACDSWIQILMDDGRQAIAHWDQHKLTCSMIDSTSTRRSESVKEHSPSVSADRPSPSHQSIPASMSHLIHPTDTPSTSPVTLSSELNEVRRRNAEQRAAVLREDPLAGQVEPLRIFCNLCQKWVQLRKDTPYCAYPWVQHKSKCVLRHEKRTQTGASGKPTSFSHGASASAGFDRISARSEDASSSHSEEDMPRVKRMKLSPASRPFPEADRDSTRTITSIDLESDVGRAAFMYQSVEYLFRTTYSPEDDMSIASLVSYLNSALPPDKYEEFDTMEVTRVAASISLRNGRFTLQGDLLRMFI